MFKLSANKNLLIYWTGNQYLNLKFFQDTCTSSGEYDIHTNCDCNSFQTWNNGIKTDYERKMKHLHLFRILGK